MKEVRFHPEAQGELETHEGWYRERSELAAQAFLLDLDHAIKSIATFPERYPRGSRGERRFVFRRYPFTLMYRDKGDHIFVTAIAHQSRRVGYWRHRK